MALSATQVWEVRTTGSDANGGAFKVGASGTDYSQQDAPQVSYTDLATQATSSQVGSAANPFVAAHVGNVLNIPTSSPSGINAGRYEIISVSNGVATLDRSAGAASATGGTGNLGGALASPGLAASQIVSGNTVWIKSGTYVVSATANISGGRVSPNVASYWNGYVASRGDATTWGTLPSLQAGANSFTIFAPVTNDISVANLEFDGNNGSNTGTVGFNATSSFRVRAWNCRAKNCGAAGFGAGGFCGYYFCEASNCVGIGFAIAGSGTALGCLAHGGSSHGFQPGVAGVAFDSCAAYGNAGDGFAVQFPLNARQCTSVGNVGAGFNLDNVGCSAVNCVAYGNTGFGFSTTTSRPDALVVNCAGGSNAAGNFHATDITAANQVNFQALTAQPFVNAAAWNFAPNSVAGGGGLLRSNGFKLFPGSGTTGYADIGAAQHQDAGGGNVSFFEG